MVKTKKTPAKKSTRTKVSLWLLIAPTALVIASFTIYAIANYAAGPADMNSSFNNGGFTPLILVNVIAFIMGLTGILTWFPALIAGIVLLATKK